MPRSVPACLAPSRSAQLEEALAAERKANAQLGVLLDALREETERKAMDIAYFESCSQLQVYSEELQAFTTQAQRELTALRRDLAEKTYVYESKLVNIHKKEELLNTFKAQHKAVMDASVRSLSSRVCCSALTLAVLLGSTPSGSNPVENKPRKWRV
jgi:hypothetical protein